VHSNFLSLSLYPVAFVTAIHNKRMITSYRGNDDAGWQPEELGEHYLVQQQIGGWPLSVFKFPERVHFPAQSTIKIWTSCSDPGLYKPPTDFVFRQLVRWSVGASICTLLCQPNGKVGSLNNSKSSSLQWTYCLYNNVIFFLSFGALMPCRINRPISQKPVAKPILAFRSKKWKWEQVFIITLKGSTSYVQRSGPRPTQNSVTQTLYRLSLQCGPHLTCVVWPWQIPYCICKLMQIMQLCQARPSS